MHNASLAPASGYEMNLSSRMEPSALLSVAMWIFILVASTLFGLFLAALVMRMTAPDWAQVGLPWQLWLSSGILLAGSASFQASSFAARAGQLTRARIFLSLAGLGAAVFLFAQLWVWQVLRAMQVTANGNPAGSFFYLLTAMHGLHVIGGLVCWLLVMRFAMRSQDSAGMSWRIALCARYWHFLLLLWVALFAALNWLTPELVRYICGIR